MALWQYTFHIIPTKSSLNFLQNLNSDFEENGFDSIPFWADKGYTRDDFKFIGKILAPSTSWSKQIDLYGDQESNCLEVFFSEAAIESVSLRIDFRTRYKFILDDLLDSFFNKRILIT
jgi:hypothetical protein